MTLTPSLQVPGKSKQSPARHDAAGLGAPDPTRLCMPDVWPYSVDLGTQNSAAAADTLSLLYCQDCIYYVFLRVTRGGFARHFFEFTDGKPGKDWWQRFKKRWPTLSERKPQHLSKKRAQAANADCMNAFFDSLEKTFVESGLDLRDPATCPPIVELR